MSLTVIKKKKGSGQHHCYKPYCIMLLLISQESNSHVMVSTDSRRLSSLAKAEGES